jgi:hypothetical protein
MENGEIRPSTADDAPVELKRILMYKAFYEFSKKRGHRI